MMKILSTDQVREADRLTIEREPIASAALMERAATVCTNWFVTHYTKDRPVFVMAGVGNNGGDALAMSRQLKGLGYDVRPFVVRYSENFSPDMQVMLDRLGESELQIAYILEEDHFPGIAPNAVIIDGIFGSGLNRPPEGLAAMCIEQINASIAEVVSIDLPSGLFADVHTPATSAVISASHTLSFQSPRLAFFVSENEGRTGNWEVLDIGLDQKYFAETECDNFFVRDLSDFAGQFQRRKFDHKGTYGHALLMAGSKGMMGAAVLAGYGAMRSGLGKLTMHIPAVGLDVLQTALPEALCEVDEYEDIIATTPNLSGFAALGCGPGIGRAKKTARLVQSLIRQSKVPMVLDADALNIIASEKGLIKTLTPGSILTPHPGEFERLFGVCKNDFERLNTLRHMAEKHKLIIVLKGAYSVVASQQGKLYFNASGNPGMATAGSGDVLTGLITGLLAQCGDTFSAAVCGVYLHGAAGDLAADALGLHGMLASDIAGYIAQAMQNNIAT